MLIAKEKEWSKLSARASMFCFDNLHLELLYLKPSCRYELDFEAVLMLDLVGRYRLVWAELIRLRSSSSSIVVVVVVQIKLSLTGLALG